MSANTVDPTEGRVLFEQHSLPKPCETWYKIYGDLRSSSTSRPLVVLHGGPGACHNYMLPLAAMWSKHGVSVVFYDQLGNGNSTHLREKRLDTSFWTPDLFMDELQNLLDKLGIVEEYDLLGQSWGGMLAAMWALRNPRGLKHLIISNSPVSMDLWIESCNSLRQQLPREVDNILEKHEQAQTYDNPDYKKAVTFFYRRHLCRVYTEDGFPRDVQDSLDWIDQDDTVYFTMNGPSEFTVIGSLKTWSLVNEVQNIEVPTLILTAEHDEAQEVCLTPWAAIPNSKRHHFQGGSHMTHVEMPDLYMEVVVDFLKSD